MSQTGLSTLMVFACDLELLDHRRVFSLQLDVAQQLVIQLIASRLFVVVLALDFDFCHADAFDDFLEFGKELFLGMNRHHGPGVSKC